MSELQRLCAEAIVYSSVVCGTGCPKMKCSTKLPLEHKEAVYPEGVNYIPLLKFKAGRRKQK